MGRHLRLVAHSPSPLNSNTSASTVAFATGKRRTMTSLGVDPGRSPGHYALFEAIRYKRHRQALLLTEAGADVNCRNDRGQTPLIYTAITVDDTRSRHKLVRLFLDAGADPNLTDWQGMTVLMHAAILGQLEVVKPLLECKWTNPGVKDPEGNTALMYAASIGHPDVLSVFISSFRHDMKALQLSQRNNQGFTALHLAARNRHDYCARLLTREAQLFPNAMETFPDPKDLEREPTPCDIKARDSGSDNKSFCSDVDTVNPTEYHHLVSQLDRNKSTNYTTENRQRVQETQLQTELNFAESSAFIAQIDSPEHTAANPAISGLRPSNCLVHVLPESKSFRDREGIFKEMTQKLVDMWPTLPCKVLVSKCTKVLEPLTTSENGVVDPSKLNTKVSSTDGSTSDILLISSRKFSNNDGTARLSDTNGRVSTARTPQDEEKQKINEPFGTIWERNSSTPHILMSRREQTGFCVTPNDSKQENLSNILPQIPPGKESSPLPPVKNVLNSCNTKRTVICTPNSSHLNVHADLPPAEFEIFKKNLMLRS